MDDKPLILVTNDDGIYAKGIRILVEEMNKIGDVYVVAPKNAQSGMGHAVTINATLQFNKLKIDEGPQIEYGCSGTPVDCVKFAINEILPRKPDICVSGINHGPNASINVLYSGTMSAAVEAGLNGIPSVGFSLLDDFWDADFEGSKIYAYKITIALLKNSLAKGIILNVNIPKLNKSDIKGIKVCRGADAIWQERFDKRTNPQGQDYYWLTGDFESRECSNQTDLWALENGYVSVVPIRYDLTAHDLINEISNWIF